MTTCKGARKHGFSFFRPASARDEHPNIVSVHAIVVDVLTLSANSRTSLGSCSCPGSPQGRAGGRYFSKRGQSSPCFDLTKVNSRTKSCEVVSTLEAHAPFNRGAFHPQDVHSSISLRSQEPYPQTTQKHFKAHPTPHIKRREKFAGSGPECSARSSPGQRG